MRRYTPRALRARGVSHLGDAERLRAFMIKLLQGGL